MSYPSIDILQKQLAESVFSNRKDTKKASGRALGTLLELVTYYIFKEWGLTNNIIIELKIPEFGNPEITHNVEFALHPILDSIVPNIDLKQIPFTTSKFKKLNPTHKNLFESYEIRNMSILTRDGVQRNNTILGRNKEKILMLNFAKSGVNLLTLSKDPYAMIECKRVGVEEGNKKGPTTIEKAKQGAYVAKSVSALQRIRTRSGQMLGFYESDRGDVSYLNYDDEINRIIYKAQPEETKGFVLTVGIVSNHGNWYSADELNKELLVLKNSYDWLLFMKDEAMVEFVQDTIIDPKESIYNEIQKAFTDSYNTEIKGNKLTKVNLYKDAHDALTYFFEKNIKHIEKNWFNVITPMDFTPPDLRVLLGYLKEKME